MASTMNVRGALFAGLACILLLVATSSSLVGAVEEPANPLRIELFQGGADAAQDAVAKFQTWMGSFTKNIPLPDALRAAIAPETEVQEQPDVDNIAAIMMDPTPAKSAGPSPEGFELAEKLLLIVGKVVGQTLVKSGENSKFDNCIECVENTTKTILTSGVGSSSIAEEIDSLCEKASSQVTAMFCDYYADFRNITVLALVSKLEINPISVSLLHCTKSGPCSSSKKDSATASQDLAYVENMSEGMLHFGLKHSLKKTMKGMKLASNLNGKTDICKDCLKLGYKVLAEIELKKFAVICEYVKDEKTQKLCEFAKEHKYLTAVALALKLKPWDLVTKGCLFKGACKPPASQIDTNKPSHMFHFFSDHASSPSATSSYFLPDAYPFNQKVKGMHGHKHHDSGNHHAWEGKWKHGLEHIRDRVLDGGKLHKWGKYSNKERKGEEKEEEMEKESGKEVEEGEEEDYHGRAVFETNKIEHPKMFLRNYRQEGLRTKDVIEKISNLFKAKSAERDEEKEVKEKKHSTAGHVQKKKKCKHAHKAGHKEKHAWEKKLPGSFSKAASAMMVYAPRGHQHSHPAEEAEKAETTEELEEYLTRLKA